LLVLAVVTSGAAIALRWYSLGQGPFFTLYEILLSNLFSLALVYVALFIRVPAVSQGALPVMVLLLLIGAWCLTEPAVHAPLPESYDNPWLWVHVGLGKLFLGLCLAATGVAVTRLGCWLLQRAAGPGGGGRRHPEDSIVWRLLSIAFVFESLMLVAGAVWAHDAWGRYWSWDSLETWALVTWLSLGALLHARLAYRSLPPVAGYLGTIIVFTLAFLTFFGVPFLSDAPHKGAF
jgi:ABC-type transport system involved in cytochrome c biogenesis permease subunit